jgi:hypothetical protein
MHSVLPLELLDAIVNELRNDAMSLRVLLTPEQRTKLAQNTSFLTSHYFHRKVIRNLLPARGSTEYYLRCHIWNLP